MKSYQDQGSYALNFSSLLPNFFQASEREFKEQILIYDGYFPFLGEVSEPPFWQVP